MRPYRILVTLAIGIGFANAANAQNWTYYDLSGGVASSAVYAVSGSTLYGGFGSAEYWLSGSATAFPLNPVGSTFQAEGAYGVHSVGTGISSGYDVPMYWASPTSNGFVMTHPANTNCSATCINGTLIGGVYQPPGGGLLRMAVCWLNAKTPYILLNPTGYVGSVCSSVSGNIEGGYVDIPTGPLHAAIWYGSAASFVDMNPNPQVESAIYGLAGNTAAGYTGALGGSGPTPMAAIWTIAPFSCTNINPAGASESVCLGCSSTKQVGHAIFGNWHAGIWSGTAANFTDLQAYVPSQYVASNAYCVEEQTNTFTIQGRKYTQYTITVGGETYDASYNVYPAEWVYSFIY